METTIKIPPTGQDETAQTLIGDYIVFVTIRHDPFCSNPLEDCDGMGRVYSLSDRHANSIDREEAERLLNEEEAVPLARYEHGLCRWFVDGETAAFIPDRQWDCVGFAGVWVPDHALLENFDTRYWNMAKGTPERAAKLRECAEQSCAVYSEWCNGHCFGYAVDVYEARYEDATLYDQRDDYRLAKAVYEDSCSGFIGDDVEDAVKESAQTAAKRIATLSTEATARA